MNVPPELRVSIIIPAYESQATVGATLQSLRGQSFTQFETILVDSGPTDAVARIAADFPEIRYEKSDTRLLPHEARNVGVEKARNDILVFTDPDIIAQPDWLEKLVEMHRRKSGPVVGAIDSLQRSWLEIGIHIAKFDLWLPGGPERNVAIAPTANFLCPRSLFRQAGGFDGREMIGDTLLSWELTRRGQTVYFAPDAVIRHDHRSTFAQLLRERYARGADFARLRIGQPEWRPLFTLATFLASILPVRLAKLMARSLACCVRSQCTGDYLRTSPVIFGGHAAWLLGEISRYWRCLFPRAENERKTACAL